MPVSLDSKDTERTLVLACKEYGSMSTKLQWVDFLQPKWLTVVVKSFIAKTTQCHWAISSHSLFFFLLNNTSKETLMNRTIPLEFYIPAKLWNHKFLQHNGRHFHPLYQQHSVLYLTITILEWPRSFQCSLRRGWEQLQLIRIQLLVYWRKIKQ